MGTTPLDLEGNAKKIWTGDEGKCRHGEGGWVISYERFKIVHGGARRQSLNENLGGHGPKNLLRGKRYCWPIDARYGLFKQIGDLQNYLLKDHAI